MSGLKKVVIFANGNLSEKFINDLTGEDYVIGVDRGAWWLLRHGVIPQMAAGDFDSVDSNESEMIIKRVSTVNIYSSEKDFTDLHLGLSEALLLHPGQIIIYGAVGSRLDHTVAAVHLLEISLDQKVETILKDERNEIRMVNDALIMYPSQEFRYFSILPFTEEVTVSISGSKYALDHKTIRRGETIGISNEFKDRSCRIKVHHGIILVIKSRD